MRTALLRVGVALYGVWLVAVVALAGSRMGLVPQHPAIHRTVLVGATVATVVGALQLLRRFYAAVAARLGRDGEP